MRQLIASSGALIQTFDSVTRANHILKQSWLMFFVVKHLPNRAWKCPEALWEDEKKKKPLLVGDDGVWTNITQQKMNKKKPSGRYGSTGWKDQAFGQNDILYFPCPTFLLCLDSHTYTHKRREGRVTFLPLAAVFLESRNTSETLISVGCFLRRICPRAQTT